MTLKLNRIIAAAAGLLMAVSASASQPRPEYPHPQFERAD